MPRLPRLVIPGIPHHITQRGNRSQTTFFEKEDYEMYKDCMSQACRQYQVQIWCYCLMTNHIHLIVVPSTKESLSKAIGRGHEMYSRYMNFKMKWRGLFWQGRYASYPMDEKHLYNCCKYIELNPVKAKVVEKVSEYPWSSARAHLGMVKDPFVDRDALSYLSDNWSAYLQEGIEPEIENRIKSHRNSGRPLGDNTFILKLEKQTGLDLRRKKPGPQTKK